MTGEMVTAATAAVSAILSAAATYGALRQSIVDIREKIDGVSKRVKEIEDSRVTLEGRMVRIETKLDALIETVASLSERIEKNFN